MAQLDVTTDACGASGIKLSHCMLLWGLGPENHSNFAYARLHAITTGKAGRPEISETGEGISPHRLHVLLRSLSQSADRALPVRPERVLHESHARCAWWRPAAPATLLFKTPELGGTVQGTVALPPLLFVRNHGTLKVAALGRNRRPAADDAVFIAPFFNVFQRGDVCAGTVPFASIAAGATGIDETERAFFGSYFTAPNQRFVHTLHPRGVYALWKDLLTARPAIQRFPMRWLAKGDGRSHAATVAAFIMED